MIQDILYERIRGFDISESALRLAALSLYVTAIELKASRDRRMSSSSRETCAAYSIVLETKTMQTRRLPYSR